MTTKQKHTQLKNLSKTTKENLHEMLKLADQILSDHDYVDGLGGEAQVLDMLSDDEFGFFGGSPSLKEMLRAYRTNPDPKVWQENRHNIWVMIDLANPKSQSETRVYTNWKLRAEKAESQLESVRNELETMRSEIEQLRTENAELSREAAELRGELRGLTCKMSVA